MVAAARCLARSQTFLRMANAGRQGRASFRASAGRPLFGQGSLLRCDCTKILDVILVFDNVTPTTDGTIE
jgi:hypothetical protein